jgi:hypothetical protein
LFVIVTTGVAHVSRSRLIMIEQELIVSAWAA